MKYFSRTPLLKVLLSKQIVATTPNGDYDELRSKPEISVNFFSHYANVEDEEKNLLMLRHLRKMEKAGMKKLFSPFLESKSDEDELNRLMEKLGDDAPSDLNEIKVALITGGDPIEDPRDKKIRELEEENAKLRSTKKPSKKK